MHQALCTEPDTQKPLSAVHFPHCRSDRKVSVLIWERSNTTANNQMLNDKAALCLAVPPLATPNVTDEMVPKSRSCSLRQLHVHIIFVWVRAFPPWYFDVCSQTAGCPVHCRMLRSIPGLDPPDASSAPLTVTTKNVSRHRQICPGCTITPPPPPAKNH